MAPFTDLTKQDFRPIKTLGHGDIGTVFLVALCRNDQTFAMKVMQKEVLQRKGEKRASTERCILSMVDHPFLPTLYAHFQSDKHVFFVMDYCSGGDLSVLRQKQRSKKFSETVTRFYAAEVVVALEYLHQQGIIYRDLKPENILIQGNGHIMLTDFDLSLVVEKTPIELVKCHTRSLGALFSCFSSVAVASQRNDSEQSHGKTRDSASSELKFATFRLPCHAWPRKSKQKRRHVFVCRSHSFVGTEEYVAPEVLWGTGHGFSVDWWTLGIFLYEMVHGKTPFKGPNRKETFYNILCKEPELPGQSPLNDLIRRLLVKRPDSRLGSAHGAEEIKKHHFFKGTMWKHLGDVGRPPFVPPPVSLVHLNDGKVQKGHFGEDDTPSKHPLCKENDFPRKDHHTTVENDEKENSQNIRNSILISAKPLDNIINSKLLGLNNEMDDCNRGAEKAIHSPQNMGKAMLTSDERIDLLKQKRSIQDFHT